MAAVYDRLGELIQVQYATAGGKQRPKIRPWPRPRTALDRERERRARESMSEIVAIFTPHELNGTHDLTNGGR